LGSFAQFEYLSSLSWWWFSWTSWYESR